MGLPKQLCYKISKFAHYDTPDIKRLQIFKHHRPTWFAAENAHRIAEAEVFATRRCRLCCETRFLSEIKVDLKLRLTKLTSWPSCQHNDNVKPGLLILAIPGPFYWERNHYFFAAQVSIDSPIPYRYCVYHGKKKKTILMIFHRDKPEDLRVPYFQTKPQSINYIYILLGTDTVILCDIRAPIFEIPKKSWM